MKYRFQIIDDEFIVSNIGKQKLSKENDNIHHKYQNTKIKHLTY